MIVHERSKTLHIHTKGYCNDEAIFDGSRYCGSRDCTPPALTNPPPGNVGRGTSATVSSPGMHVPLRVITTGPDAYVDASVRAGEIPYAKAIPKHDDIDDVHLGGESRRGHWEGWASATLTRTIRHPSSGVVTVEPPKTLSKDLVIEIEQVKETVLEQGFELFVPEKGFGNVNGAAIGFGVGEGIGVVSLILALGLGFDGMDNELKEYSHLELVHDPICRLEIPAWVPVLPPPLQPLTIPAWNTYCMEVIESSATLSGEWGNELGPMLRIESGGHDLYQKSHSHHPWLLHP